MHLNSLSQLRMHFQVLGPRHEILPLLRRRLDAEPLEILRRHGPAFGMGSERLPDHGVGVVFGFYALAEPFIERRDVINVAVFIEGTGNIGRLRRYGESRPTRPSRVNDQAGYQCQKDQHGKARTTAAYKRKSHGSTG